MKYVTLGSSGLITSELVFGTLAVSRLQADLPPAQGARVIVCAVELGVTALDTAQAYGSYEHVAHALRLLGRDASRVSIFSKSLLRTAPEIYHAVDEARSAMNRDVIDAFHLHALRSPEDFRDRAGALDALRDLRSRGVIRAIAASFHFLAAVPPILNCPDITLVMPSVNRLGLGITGGSLADVLAACRAFKAAGKGVYAMKPLAGGHLHDSVPDALNFVRSLDEIDAVAVGIKTIPELELDVAVFDDRPVSAELLAAAAARPRRIFIELPTCQGCGACAEQCDHHALAVIDGKASVDSSRCVLCGYCGRTCPTMAIRII